VREPVVFGVNPLIADMDPLIRRIAGDRIELATIQGAGLWPVQLRPGDLEQVLLALVASACEGMPDGGTLQIGTRNVVLDEEYARRFRDVAPGEYVLLEVVDTGPGLSDSVKARIFESFLSAAAPAQATALAFSLSYGIVRHAGGHLELCGAAGAGTTVRIYLPCVGTPVGSEEAREFAGALGGSETVLIVEDEKSVLSVTSRTLTQLGYGVLTAASGEDALRIFGSRASGSAAPAESPAVDLMLTDIMLPGIDGVELSKQVRALRPDIVIVFMSGHSPEAMRLGDTAGPDYRLLEKPFTISALGQTVRTALDAAQRPRSGT
jgi:CheY-like chemotaxis protein